MANTRKNLADKIKLGGYDALFGEPEGEQIVEAPLDNLHNFKNHPFRVSDDEKMEETVESVKQYGVLVPGIARPRKGGGYEIISGHRRKRASELAGRETMPVVVRQYSDDEATIIMVDANIQREDILPGEKAKAYRMKYEAMKHQGKKAGGRTIEEMGEDAGESAKTVQRYLWLSHLSDGLLDLVDRKKLGFMQGVDISFLTEEAQGWVYVLIAETGAGVSAAQSAYQYYADLFGESKKTVKTAIDRLEELQAVKRHFRTVSHGDGLISNNIPQSDRGMAAPKRTGAPVTERTACQRTGKPHTRGRQREKTAGA